MIDLLHEIWQTMRMNKLRTILTGVAVSWGVFMLIVLLSMARGVTNMFEYYRSSEIPKIRVHGGYTSIPYRGVPEGRYIRLSEKDRGSVEESDFRHVSEVTSVMSWSGMIFTPKAQVSSGYDGVFPSYGRSGIAENLICGRFINERDMDEKSKVMVIPKYYAMQLFPPDGKDACGGRIACKGLSFKVVGVYDSRWSRDVLIPYTTARAIAENKDEIGYMTVALKDVDSEKAAGATESGVRHVLARNHGYDPADNNAVYIFNSYTTSMKQNIALLILDTSVWVLGILTLLTGIVGISNIMFVTVRERTHEIGVRRAIGAKPYKILMQVISESVSVTLVFGYVGIVLGMAVTQVIARLTEDSNVLRNPTVSIAIAVEVTLFLVLSGALAGLFPALKALKIKPVEALRDE